MNSSHSSVLHSLVFVFAELNVWHGGLPMTTSIFPTNGLPSKILRSWQTALPIFAWYVSQTVFQLSTPNTCLNPAFTKPRENPPAPQNKSMKVGPSFTHSPFLLDVLGLAQWADASVALDGYAVHINIDVDVDLSRFRYCIIYFSLILLNPIMPYHKSIRYKFNNHFIQATAIGVAVFDVIHYEKSVRRFLLQRSETGDNRYIKS